MKSRVLRAMDRALLRAKKTVSSATDVVRSAADLREQVTRLIGGKS